MAGRESPTRTLQPPSEEEGLIREEFGDARTKIGTKSPKEIFVGMAELYLPPKRYYCNTRHDSVLLLFLEMQF